MRKITDIIWDTDESEELAKLPTEMEIPEEIVGEDAIYKYVATKTGCKCNGFNVKKKYRVDITRYGCIFVEASSEEEAWEIADHQTTDTVQWYEDWEPIDVNEDESAVESAYVTEKQFEQKGKIMYTLVGVDGNAYAIMGYTSRALKETGHNDLCQEMVEKATSGDYNNLIRVCCEYIDIANASLEEE